MRRDRLCAAVLGLVGCLAVGCTGNSTAEAGRPPVERDYWPTEAWRTDDPADHGFEETELAELEQLVADSFTNVRSIAIVRDGYLIYERYWQGLGAEDGHDVRSVTKSVVSALVGIALGDGLIESLDQTVGDLFPDRLPAGADPRMAGVTVRQLLSMTAGLPADDPSLGGDEKVLDAVVRSPDWVRAILSLPLTAAPGTRFGYSSASSHLLSALVADATGGSTLEFARKRLFEPLGIDSSDFYEPAMTGPLTAAQAEQYSSARVAWPTDPQGYQFGFAFLKLPTRDLAKFGFMYLNKGRWEGKQLIPRAYVRDSTMPGGTPTHLSQEYGWQWWVPTEADHESFFARGYGGQLIEVVSDLDLVAVVTSDPETSTGDTHTLVENIIVPAAED